MPENLIARHELRIYASGKAELLPLAVDTSFGECSSSIKQIIMIVEAVMKYYAEEGKAGRHIHFAVTTAVNSVAYKLNVSNPTVYTKITRKLGISMREFKDMLKVCLDSNAPDGDEFVEKLKSCCVNRTKLADEAAVNQLVAKIRNRTLTPSATQ